MGSRARRHGTGRRRSRAARGRAGEQAPREPSPGAAQSARVCLGLRVGAVPAGAVYTLLYGKRAV